MPTTNLSKTWAASPELTHTYGVWYGQLTWPPARKLAPLANALHV
jgi:hypothetical protein